MEEGAAQALFDRSIEQQGMKQKHTHAHNSNLHYDEQATQLFR